MADNFWLNCKITAWSDLRRLCEGCGKPKADYEMTFSNGGLPTNYFRHGTHTRSWHSECLPEQLREFLNKEIENWKEVVKTPM